MSKYPFLILPIRVEHSGLWTAVVINSRVSRVVFSTYAHLTEGAAIEHAKRVANREAGDRYPVVECKPANCVPTSYAKLPFDNPNG